MVICGSGPNLTRELCGSAGSLGFPNPDLFDRCAHSGRRLLTPSSLTLAIPGPNGKTWVDTTIRDQADRGTGILNNELYRGELAWNRCSYIKNPETGKRVSRPNPPETWEREPVPELRIVSDELWDAVKQQQADCSFEMGRNEGGQALNRAHRNKFLLSGLLKCGLCGGNMSIVRGKDLRCKAMIGNSSPA